jgi:hypothetical protein
MRDEIRAIVNVGRGPMYTDPSEADDLAHVLVWLLDHCALPNVGDTRGILA